MRFNKSGVMMVNRTLPVIPALLLACNPVFCAPSYAAEFEVVRQQTRSQADVTTHEIRSGDVVLGISGMGGGYINKLFIPGVGDILGEHAARYGRGGQVAMRDLLHGGRYNPTQAGFTDSAGTICRIEQPSPGTLHIPPRPLALWNGDHKYDFTEWENLAADPYARDRGNTDQDGLDESRLAGRQATEITSEFDFTATYRDVRDGVRVTIPTFHFEYELRFLRMPGHAISQFRKGTPIYDAGAEIADRSNLAPPGKHPSSEDSLTGIVLTSTIRGDKSVWAPNVAFSVDKQGKLAARPLKGALRIAYQAGSRLDVFPLVIFSTSTDPARGPAIGYFQPDSHVNQYSVVGRSLATNEVLYEDRRAKSGTILGNSSRTKDMWLFGFKSDHTGLLSRKETPKGAYEAIRGESYILVGTPQEILAAARALQASKERQALGET
jgi:hypothetical protein